MKKLSIVFFCLTIAAFLSGLPAYAQRGNGGGPGAGGGIGNAGGPSSAGQTRGNSSTNTNASGKTENKSQPKNPTSDDKNATISDRISSNSRLDAKVKSLLPAGMTLQQASSGFKNEGQFIAALHVSKNLNIPFDQLKTKMTGPNPESLGKAIHDLRPDLTASKANDEAKKGEKEAKETEKSSPKTT